MVNFVVPNTGENVLGFNVHSAEYVAQFEAIAKLTPARIVRFDLDPALILDGKWHFYDNAVDKCVSLGLQPLMLISSLPVKFHAQEQLDKWAKLKSREPTLAPYRQTRFAPTQSPVGFDWFVNEFWGAALARYKGYPVGFDLWNEGNWELGMITLDAVLNTPISPSLPTEYVKLIQACMARRKQVHPTAVVSINTAGRAYEWLSRVLGPCLTSGVRLVLPHPYTPSGPPEEAIGDLGGVKAMCDHYKPAGATIKLGVGEWGYKRLPSPIPVAAVGAAGAPADDDTVAGFITVDPNREMHMRMYKAAKAARSRFTIIYNWSHTDLPWEVSHEPGYWDFWQ